MGVITVSEWAKAAAFAHQYNGRALYLKIGTDQDWTLIQPACVRSRKDLTLMVGVLATSLYHCGDVGIKLILICLIGMLGTLSYRFVWLLVSYQATCMKEYAMTNIDVVNEQSSIYLASLCDIPL